MGGGNAVRGVQYATLAPADVAFFRQTLGDDGVAA